VYWKDHREQLRQSESQRAVLTNYVLVIVAGLTGFAAQQKFALSTIPVAVLITLLGFYGALTSAKYHERANYHLTQARAITKALVESGTLGSDADLDAARTAHYVRYSRLHRLRLHALWTGLHLGVAVLGITLAVLGAMNA
jgi:hypothetical protein